MAYDPSMTAPKVADMLANSDALNASGKPSDAPGFVSTKGYIDARRRKRPDYDSLAPEHQLMIEGQTVPVYVFNVGPFAHTIPCGSAGTFYIPACPPDKPYVQMLTPLFVVQTEIYPKTRTAQAKRLYDDGRKMAIEILGEGRGQHKRNSKRHVGVFVADSSKPKPKEIEDAKAAMTAYASEQVLYMDNLWDSDRKLAHEAYRAESYGACARWLGLTGKNKPWLAQGQASDQVRCPWCQEMVSPDAALCRNCHQVVNQQKFNELKGANKTLMANS